MRKNLNRFFSFTRFRFLSNNFFLKKLKKSKHNNVSEQRNTHFSYSSIAFKLQFNLIGKTQSHYQFIIKTMCSLLTVTLIFLLISILL